ncbi:ribonuclease H1 [Xylocopa sonorina]|uniref:ribonuclease H1 n=1 Tax=Xylocopa sonorina TaxID=1818115 RepID=UPI00403ACA0B
MTFVSCVAKGRKPGIYKTWNECKLQVNQFSGPVFKKFNSQHEAEEFIKQNTGQGTNKKQTIATFGKRSHPQIEKPSEVENKKPAAKKLKQDNSEECKKTIYIESKKVNGEFSVDNRGYVNVYTDGACSSNGGKNPRAGIGVWFGDNNPLNVSEPVIGRATNNMAEIQAVTVAARQAQEAGIKNLKVNTDSKFLISCANDWMPKWKANGWKTASNKPVINKTELLEMEQALKPLNVDWNHVNGHVGIYGNEMADQLARKGCSRY